MEQSLSLGTLSLRTAAPVGFSVARPRHTTRTKRVNGIHFASPLLVVVMLTHVIAASVPGDMYVMDSGAEEHVSREVDIFTNVNTGASVPLQTAAGPDEGTCLRHGTWATMSRWCPRSVPPGADLECPST